MRILAYGNSHDSSWMYYDQATNKLYFFSAEREYNVKHATIRFKDMLFILRDRFGFDPLKNKDDIVIGWQPKLPPLINNELFPTKKQLFTIVNDQYILLDHHLCHILSSLALDDSIESGIAIDAEGDHNWKCMVINNLQDIHNLQFFIPEGNPAIGKLFKYSSAAIKLKKPQITVAEMLQEANQNVGKIMGLQSYGKRDIDFYNRLNEIPIDSKNVPLFTEIFKEEFKDINVYDQMDNFDKVTTTYQFLSDKVVELFDKYMDKNKKIAYCGGCALSTVANDLLISNGYDVTVCPAANDMGLAIGAMKFADRYFNLGIDFSNLVYSYYDDDPDKVMPDKNIKFAAELLKEGEIIAFVNGCGEVGPRALGHRSILMNPAIPNGKDFINEKVKHREWWRPFGGSCIDTSIIKDYTKSDLDYYMLRNFQIKDEWKERLNSIVHVDGSCRLQITNNKDEPLYKVIDEFRNLTGIPAVLNTSYNIGGKPIPNYRKHIMETFRNLDNINYLFYNDKIYIKRNNKIEEYII